MDAGSEGVHSFHLSHRKRRERKNAEMLREIEFHVEIVMEKRQTGIEEHVKIEM